MACECTLAENRYNNGDVHTAPLICTRALRVAHWVVNVGRRLPPRTFPATDKIMEIGNSLTGELNGDAVTVPIIRTSLTGPRLLLTLLPPGGIGYSAPAWLLLMGRWVSDPLLRPLGSDLHLCPRKAWFHFM